MSEQTVEQKVAELVRDLAREREHRIGDTVRRIMQVASSVPGEPATMREYLLGDAHHEMQTTSGILRLLARQESLSAFDQTYLKTLGNRLAACCARGRDIAACEYADGGAEDAREPRFVVTDEMIDRAVLALHPGPGKPATSEREWIRPAIEAALNGGRDV